jgi:hypothetical protein
MSRNFLKRVNEICDWQIVGTPAQALAFQDCESFRRKPRSVPKYLPVFALVSATAVS